MVNWEEHSRRLTGPWLSSSVTPDTVWLEMKSCIVRKTAPGGELNQRVVVSKFLLLHMSWKIRKNLMELCNLLNLSKFVINCFCIYESVINCFVVFYSNILSGSAAKRTCTCVEPTGFVRVRGGGGLPLSRRLCVRWSYCSQVWESRWFCCRKTQRLQSIVQRYHSFIGSFFPCLTISLCVCVWGGGV